MSYNGLVKVISGGQIGADIAGIRAAKVFGLETGGWMPKRFMAKDGFHPEYAEEYGILEHLSAAYPPRTRLNVQHSDGTLRFAYNFNSAGERCTMYAINQYSKPYMDIDLKVKRSMQPLAEEVADWIIVNEIATLNVAGNADKQIEKWIERFLTRVFNLTCDPEVVPL